MGGHFQRGLIKGGRPILNADCTIPEMGAQMEYKEKKEEI
jgi:hypothetical protein